MEGKGTSLKQSSDKKGGIMQTEPMDLSNHDRPLDLTLPTRKRAGTKDRDAAQPVRTFYFS